MTHVGLRLIHPRMLTGLDAFYPSEIVIESRTDVQDTSGHPEPTWTTFLECKGRVSPKTAVEQRLPDQTYKIGTHVLALQGYYPTITVKMRALVGSIYHDITAVEHDGQSHTSRLTAEVVE